MGMLAGTALAGGAVQAQQVNAGAGDDINVDGRSVTTTGGIPALYAHDGGRIYNQVGAGNAVTVTTSSYGAYATSTSTINLDGGGSIITSGVNAFGLYATGAGSKITSIANVTTSGAGADGAAATGGTITLNGGVITTTGDNAAGLVTNGGGTIYSAATVSTGGNGSFGAYASGGTINLTGGSITTTGGVSGNHSAFGLYTLVTGTITSVVDVTTSGAGAIGVAASGGTINLNGGTITTTGDSAFGLIANAGGGNLGTINSAATVSTANATAYGAYASGAGSKINLTGGSVTTTGNNAPGLYADTGGKITSNVDISTSGSISYGASAAAGSSIELTGGLITASGFDGRGLAADGAGSSIISSADVRSFSLAAWTKTGSITLKGGSLTTTGDGNAGLYAEVGGTISGTANVSTLGANGVGAIATTNSTITLTGGSVTTVGAGSFGLFSNIAGIITSVADVTTSGTGAHGAFASGGTIGGTINLNGGTISTSGQGAHGLYSSSSGGGSGANITAMGVTVAVTGPGAAGALIQDAGGFTLSNSQISSAQSNALWSTTSAAGITNTAQITRSVLSSASDTAMVFQGGTQNFSLQLSQVSGGNGTLFKVDYGQPGGVVDLTNPGHLTLSVAASNLTGDMAVVDPGTNTADITLSDGTNWTGASLGVSNLTVDGSTWNVTGDSTLTGTLTNSGTVAFASGGPFKTLTTTNYVGNGGTLGLNAALGGNGSPTDQLIINGGAATGTTGITVTNAGGAGALTSGLGIPVVVAINGGTTANGAFQLTGIAAAGPYEYLLFHGNTASPPATAEQMQGWYLRSHYDGSLLPPLPPPPPCPNPNVCPGPGPAPTPQPIPLYRPEAPVYAAAAGTARGLGMTLLGTFHERAGDQSLLRGSGPVPGAWGRWIGQKTEMSHGGPLSPKFDGTVTGLQTGLDLYGFERPGYGHDRFGVFFGYGRSLGDVKGFALGQQGYKAGKMDMSGYSVGGTWTHVGSGGWYLDAVLMGTRYDGDPRSNRGHGAKVKGYGLTASLESGLPLALGRGLTLEPQAQIVWQHLKLDDTYDRFATIAYDTPDTLAGRFGLRLSGAFQAGGAVLKPYITANLWQDFAGSDKTIFSGTALRSGGGNSTSAELTGGMVAQVTKAVGLWGDVSYLTDIAGPDRQAWRGNVGVRVTW